MSQRALLPLTDERNQPQAGLGGLRAVVCARLHATSVVPRVHAASTCAVRVTRLLRPGAVATLCCEQAAGCGDSLDVFAKADRIWVAVGSLSVHSSRESDHHLKDGFLGSIKKVYSIGMDIYT